MKRIKQYCCASLCANLILCLAFCGQEGNYGSAPEKREGGLFWKRLPTPSRNLHPAGGSLAPLATTQDVPLTIYVNEWKGQRLLMDGTLKMSPLTANALSLKPEEKSACEAILAKLLRRIKERESSLAKVVQDDTGSFIRIPPMGREGEVMIDEASAELRDSLAPDAASSLISLLPLETFFSDLDRERQISLTVMDTPIGRDVQILACTIGANGTRSFEESDPPFLPNAAKSSLMARYDHFHLLSEVAASLKTPGN